MKTFPHHIFVAVRSHYGWPARAQDEIYDGVCQTEEGETVGQRHEREVFVDLWAEYWAKDLADLDKLNEYAAWAIYNLIVSLDAKDIFGNVNHLRQDEDELVAVKKSSHCLAKGHDW